jgi:signal peptidase I
VKPFQIPSASMEPTLDIGQRVLVNRFSTRVGADPEVGDVVVFHPPTECGVPATDGRLCSEPGLDQADENFIKRVVAGPGDRLRVVDGIPVVDGDPVEGTWETIPCRTPSVPCNYPRAITIPADHYFMMGDNRPASQDSRFWGPVPRAWIVGEAFATYWPLNRIGSL